MTGRAGRGFARLALRPFRALIALLFTVNAVTYLAGLPQPVSVDVVLPHGVRVAWGACLLLGGTLILGGLASGRRPIEAAGLWLMAAGASVYAIALFAVAGGHAALPGGLVLSVAAACLIDTSDRIHDWAQRQLAGGLR